MLLYTTKLFFTFLTIIFFSCEEATQKSIDDNNYHPFMVIITKTIIELPTRLMDVPNPPGAKINNIDYVTRTSKRDLKTYKIPLLDYGNVVNLQDNSFNTLWDDADDQHKINKSFSGRL